MHIIIIIIMFFFRLLNLFVSLHLFLTATIVLSIVLSACGIVIEPLMPNLLNGSFNYTYPLNCCFPHNLYLRQLFEFRSVEVSGRTSLSVYLPLVVGG